MTASQEYKANREGNLRTGRNKGGNDDQMAWQNDFDRAVGGAGGAAAGLR
jgi:hypothetical protein